MSSLLTQSMKRTPTQSMKQMDIVELSDVRERSSGCRDFRFEGI